ncbi:MAG: hypothetical protein IKE03_08760, partial [Blautia sp.]|nr:hypothetical protein [Blautia sp.]
MKQIPDKLVTVQPASRIDCEARETKVEQLHKPFRLCAGLAVAAVAAVVCPAAAARAAWSLLTHSINLLTVSSFQTRIEEEYTAPEHVDPAQTVDKIVYARNTGTCDAIVRMKIRPVFGTVDEEGVFREDPELDPSWIRLEYDDTGTWKEMDDGYYYLTQVLRPGERSSAPLLKAFTLDENTPNTVKGKDGRIFVSLEGIQAAGEAVRSWGRTEDELDIAYREAVYESEAFISFKGPDEGFVFDKEGTDLFRSFKLLTPGCSRTQSVELSNDSDEETSFLLQALIQDQEALSPEELERIYRLLQEYATVSVRLGDEILYQGSADGNPEHRENAQSMGKPILLGTLAPGEKTELLISLAVDPQMDNAFMDLAGKVHWVFYAAGDSGMSPGEP